MKRKSNPSAALVVTSTSIKEDVWKVNFTSLTPQQLKDGLESGELYIIKRNSDGESAKILKMGLSGNAKIVATLFHDGGSSHFDEKFKVE